ncbi:MAG TPA: ATP-binding protein [Acidimicrobiales bacterium]|nr:ATP-binding protein [Acidimicrobiales bacterium]
MTTAADTSNASTAQVGRVLRLRGSEGDPNLSRAFVEPLVRDWKRETLEFDVALVTTELVTNAVLHAQSAIVLAIRPIAKGLRIEVTDTRPSVLPHMAPRWGASSSPLTLGQSGRGLQLVSELASRWGVNSTQRTKTVWAELIDGLSGPTEPLLQLEYELLVRGGVNLVFLDLPTVTAVESGVQVEDVVRAIQLEHGAMPPDDHGVGRLYELLLTTAADRLAGRHAALWAAAEDRPAFDLDVATTVDAMRDLGELSRMLEHPGDLLAIAPPHPTDAVVRLRRWLQEETARQLSRQPPRSFPA